MVLPHFFLLGHFFFLLVVTYTRGGYKSSRPNLSRHAKSAFFALVSRIEAKREGRKSARNSHPAKKSKYLFRAVFTCSHLEWENGRFESPQFRLWINPSLMQKWTGSFSRNFMSNCGGRSAQQIRISSLEAEIWSWVSYEIFFVC